jgi:flagellin FlaB
MQVQMPHKRDRGQVGIGTLIVFIAMVLVAAIAAGVLINTAGFLQSQSEQTGQQSSAQVSDRLQVVNTVGESVTNQQVHVINMTVKKAPGANDIDLNSTTMQFISNEQIVDLVHAARDSPGSEFQTSTIQDDDDSIETSKVLNSQEDRAVVTLDIGNNTGTDNVTSVNTANISTLGEGSEATIEVTTQAGGTTTATVTVPDSLSGKSSVSL